MSFTKKGRISKEVVYLSAPGVSQQLRSEGDSIISEVDYNSSISFAVGLVSLFRPEDTQRLGSNRSFVSAGCFCFLFLYSHDFSLK
jgi:hypothetical protein